MAQSSRWLTPKKFGRKHPYKFLRWLAPVAAAAVFLLVIMWNPQLKTFFLDNLQKPSVQKLETAQYFNREDIDRNGSVDILDAMKLDLKIKNAKTNLDLDVRWDLNNDYIVNKKDVDTIAFAAVRLNKGV